MTSVRPAPAGVRVLDSDPVLTRVTPLPILFAVDARPGRHGGSRLTQSRNESERS